MRILIIGTPRTGTQSLLMGLGKVLNLEIIPEPFDIYNPHILKKYPFTPRDRSITKTMINHVPTEFDGTPNQFYHKFIKKFDNIIILSRKNTIEQYDSWIHSLNSNKSWHIVYQKSKQPFKKDIYNCLMEWRNQLHEFSSQTHIPITFYEKLYSGNISDLTELLEKWKIEIPMNKIKELSHELDPKYKYGKKIKQSII